MKSYEVCPKSVSDRSAALLKKHFPLHHKAGVKVDHLFVSHDGDGPALKLGGYACAGVIRKTSTKERAAGRGDAEMVLDESRWDGMDEREQAALLHHELYHLVLVPLNKGGQAHKIDAVGRPVLKIRLHDHQFGWFDEIARLYGEDSGEVQQARRLLQELGQLYFNFDGSAPLTAALKDLAKLPDGVTSMSITTPGSGGVKIDSKGIHPEPAKEQLDDATKLAFEKGAVTRSMIQRHLRTGYNLACIIVERLQQAKVLGEEADGKFPLIAA